MELVKYTDEEQAKIKADQVLSHVVVVILAPLAVGYTRQTTAEEMIISATEHVKARADRARMLILNKSISTDGYVVNGVMYLSLVLFCQWAEIDKLEKMQREQALANTGRRGA